MKNMKKVLAVMTAVSAMAASTSAFAANVATVTGVTGTYAAGKLSVTVPTEAKSGEMTLLVLTEGALAATTTEEANVVNDGEILYIDQQTFGTEGAFQGMGLKTDILAAATTGEGHIIKVGYYDATGEFQIAEGKITVVAETPAGKTITFVWGDVNNDTGVDDEDTMKLLMYSAGGEKTFGEYTIGVEANVWVPNSVETN